MLDWFREHFLHGNEGKAQKKQEGGAEEEQILLSKLPEYEFDDWQKTHKGYRKQTLAKFLGIKVTGIILAILVIATCVCLALSYITSTSFYVDPVTLVPHMLPDPTLFGVTEILGLILLAFVGAAFGVWRYYNWLFNLYYDNSTVVNMYATNFLNERWPITLYNGGMPEKEPLGTSMLENQKTSLTAAITKLAASLTDPQTDGGTVNLVMVEAEITKYKAALAKCEDYLNAKATVFSIESRDHKFIWKDGVLEREQGWKIYIPVKGPSIYDCTGFDENPVDLGFKTKKLFVLNCAVNIDLPPMQEIIRDDETGNEVIVDIPTLGLRDTPNGGAYYTWSEADGLMVKGVLDVPTTSALTSQIHQLNSVVAEQQARILRYETEGPIILMPEILQRLGLAGKVPEIARLGEQQPQSQLAAQAKVPEEKKHKSFFRRIFKL